MPHHRLTHSYSDDETVPIQKLPEIGEEELSARRLRTKAQPRERQRQLSWRPTHRHNPPNSRTVPSGFGPRSQAAFNGEGGRDRPVPDSPVTHDHTRFERPDHVSGLKDLPFPARLAAAGNVHVYAVSNRPRDYHIYLSSLQRMMIC
jgi:hypothetical protein